MSDTDKLRPEVQIAMRELREALRVQGVGSHGPQFTTIRAELLRLATIEADALIALDCEHDWQVEHKRAEKAEAELAALKARIAEAPTAQLIDQGRATQQWYVRATDGGLLALPPALSGKRVRLLVEE